MRVLKMLLACPSVSQAHIVTGVNGIGMAVYGQSKEALDGDEALNQIFAESKKDTPGVGPWEVTEATIANPNGFGFIRFIVQQPTA